MQDEIQSQRVVCVGGLNTSQNFLLLSEQSMGSAVSLTNYETSPSGGYRRISGYAGLDPDYKEVTSGANPAEGAVLGVWLFLDNNDTIRRIAARKVTAGATYRFYELTPGVGWAVIATIPARTSTGVSRIRFADFVSGDTRYLAFVDGVNKAAVWDGATTEDIDIAASGGTGGDQAIEAPKYVSFFANTLFLAGDPSYPGIVAHSAPDDWSDWTVALGAGQILPKFDVVQIEPFRDELYVFGEKAISKIIPDTAFGFVINEVTSNIGCIASDSVVEVGGNLLYLSSDGIRPIAGTARIGDVELDLISQQIQNTTISFGSRFTMTDLVSIVLRGKNQFRYFMDGTTISDEIAYGLLGAVRTYGGEHSWEYSELLGLHANCTWSGYVNGEEKFVFGNYAGLVYEMEVGSSFDGDPITSVYQTPYLDFGDTTIRKNIRRVDLFVRIEGPFEQTVNVTYDWDRTDVINPVSYDISAGSDMIAYGDGSTYGDGSVYAGSSQPVFFINTQGSGYAVQVSLTQTATVVSPYTIQGLVFSFTPKGRN